MKEDLIYEHMFAVLNPRPLSCTKEMPPTESEENADLSSNSTARGSCKGDELSEKRGNEESVEVAACDIKRERM